MPFLTQAAKLIAGRMQGANNQASFIVKTARGIYLVEGGLILFIWYSAYRNERVSPGEVDFPIPFVSSKKRINRPDRPELATEAEVAVIPNQSTVLPGGQIGEPLGGPAPPGIQKVVNWINSVSGKYPYAWGGGHSQIGIPSGGGFDCSGAISGAVGQLGPTILRTPVTSGEFANIFPSGEGKWITIYGNTSSPNFPVGHVFMKIKVNGVWHWFGTGSEGKDLRGGPAWGNNAIADASEFQVSHPPGY